MTMEPVGRVRFFTPEVARVHHTDWLFLETMRDLRERMTLTPTPENRYAILCIAPLLRKMIADGGKSLVQAVRRASTDRPKPTFRGKPYEFGPIPHPDAKIIFGYSADGLLDPDASMTLEQFLKMPVGHAVKYELTVLDAVKHYANVEGGVHLGTSKSEANTFLQIASPASGAILPGFYRVLTQIAEVVVDGCAELERVVAAELAERDANPPADALTDLRILMGIWQP